MGWPSLPTRGVDGAVPADLDDIVCTDAPGRSRPAVNGLLSSSSQATVQTKSVSFRRVCWSFPSVNCPGCASEAQRVWESTRVAVDIDLDQPIVLVVDVSVHVCSACNRMFRAQPPFLRPRAIYTRRVVQKAVEAVFCDGMAARCVPDRLARDFWVKPSEKMVRLWCHAYAAEIDFKIDYQPWVVANFSGILCVDEVYQGDLALLLAVDPAAPDGDRLIGYTLLPKAKEVNQSMVTAFIERLRAAGCPSRRGDYGRLAYIPVGAGKGVAHGDAPAVLVPCHAAGSSRGQRCSQPGPPRIADPATGKCANAAWQPPPDTTRSRPARCRFGALSLAPGATRVGHCPGACLTPTDLLRTSHRSPARHQPWHRSAMAQANAT